MTLATMTDRTLTLAERVQAFALGIPPLPGWDQGYTEWRIDLAALLADVAAADRVMLALRRLDECDTGDRAALDGAWCEYRAARIAYRARMAQCERVYPACKGRNCGCTDGKSHSPQCAADHEAAYEGVAHGVTHPANGGGGE